VVFFDNDYDHYCWLVMCPHWKDILFCLSNTQKITAEIRSYRSSAHFQEEQWGQGHHLTDSSLSKG
jgi:transposase